MGDFTRDSPSSFGYSADMKIKLPTVEFYAWAWLTALMLRAIYSILLRLHFGDFPAPEIFCLMLPQILFLSGFLLWRKRTEKTRKLKSDLWKKIWKLYKLNPIFQIHELPRRTFVQIVLVGSLCHSVYVIACSTSLITSMALCTFKLYEPAERLYSKTPWPVEKQDLTFIGAWDGIGHADLNVNTEKEINSVIAGIYGITSPQMGYRLYLLGKQNRCCAVRNLQRDNKEQAKELAFTSIRNFSWSYQIYSSCQSKCLKEVSNCLEILGYGPSHLDILGNVNPDLVSYEIKDRYLKRVCIVRDLTENEPGKPYVGRSEFYNDYHLTAQVVAVLIPLFLIASCYGCSSPLAKTLTIVFEIMWTKRILESTLILEKRLECLSKLSLLLLYQGKIEEAEICSRKMLALAESNSSKSKD